MFRFQMSVLASNKASSIARIFQCRCQRQREAYQYPRCESPLSINHMQQVDHGCSQLIRVYRPPDHYPTQHQHNETRLARPVTYQPNKKDISNTANTRYSDGVMRRLRDGNALMCAVHPPGVHTEQSKGIYRLAMRARYWLGVMP